MFVINRTDSLADIRAKHAATLRRLNYNSILKTALYFCAAIWRTRCIFFRNSCFLQTKQFGAKKRAGDEVFHLLSFNHLSLWNKRILFLAEFALFVNSFWLCPGRGVSSRFLQSASASTVPGNVSCITQKMISLE